MVARVLGWLRCHPSSLTALHSASPPALPSPRGNTWCPAPVFVPLAPCKRVAASISLPTHPSSTGRDPQENLEALEEFKEFTRVKGLVPENLVILEQMGENMCDPCSPLCPLELSHSHVSCPQHGQCGPRSRSWSWEDESHRLLSRVYSYLWVFCFLQKNVNQRVSGVSDPFNKQESCYAPGPRSPPGSPSCRQEGPTCCVPGHHVLYASTCQSHPCLATTAWTELC